MSRKVLKIVSGILGMVPLLTGLVTMMGVYDPIYANAGLPGNPLLDSNLRFFGGVWFGLGVAFLWLIPKIEAHAVLFRVIWGAIFVGGIGRLLSIIFVGTPPIPFIMFTALEVIGAPLFVYWHYVVCQPSPDMAVTRTPKAP